MLSLPVRSSDVKPFHVNAECITAGQNGATFWDQSSAFISCHSSLQIPQLVMSAQKSSYLYTKMKIHKLTPDFRYWSVRKNEDTNFQVGIFLRQ